MFEILCIPECFLNSLHQGAVVTLLGAIKTRTYANQPKFAPPTPNSGGARDQSPPELGDLGGECVSPKNVNR